MQRKSSVRPRSPPHSNQCTSAAIRPEDNTGVWKEVVIVDVEQPVVATHGQSCRSENRIQWVRLLAVVFLEQ